MDVIERIALAKDAFERQTLQEATQVFLPPDAMEELKRLIPDADFIRVLGLFVYEFDGIHSIFCEAGSIPPNVRNVVVSRPQHRLA